MSTSKILLALAVSVCLAQTTRADGHCDSAEAAACERCLPCVTLPVEDGTKTSDDEDCSTSCDDCVQFQDCQECNAGATTPVGLYNAACETECTPCTILPNDGKTASGASCETCSACEQYGLTCIAVGCDSSSDYYKACETECTQCIGAGDGSKTKSGASCDTCDVCSPLAECTGSKSEYQSDYTAFCNSAEAASCERCLPCVTLPVEDGVKTSDGAECSTCEECSKYEFCQDCDAGATTPVGLYNAACETECTPCTILPNDGKTKSGASCETCAACEQYGLQCMAVDCDTTSEYYKACETECTQCIGAGDGSTTKSGASCDTCEVCEPLIECVGSLTAAAAETAGVTLTKAAVPAKAAVPVVPADAGDAGVVVTTAGATIVYASLATVGAAAVAWIL